MKNRFRFRVYEKSTCRMIYDVQETYDSYLGCCFSEASYESYYELMQCTGIKDNKGRLIFEGDIVLSFSSLGMKKVVVKWEKNGWNINDIVNNIIIGNIYNPKENVWWNYNGVDHLTEEKLNEILTEDL